MEETKMIRRRDFMAGSASVLAAPMIVSRAFAQDPEVTLQLHHFLSPQAPAHTKMLAPWAKSIEDDSDGRIRININPSMSLGGAPPQLFRQVVDGVVDIVWTVNGYTPGLFPRSEIFELPTIYVNDPAATNLAMRDLFDSHLAEEYEPVHVLFLHVHAGQGIHMAQEPVRTPEDTVGKKLRVPGPTGNAIVEAMGATPVTMPVPDLPQALSTNAVDGALIPWEIIQPLQLQETTDYQIEGPDKGRFGTTVFQVSMNKARWDGLPDDLKEIFDRNSGEDWLREVAQIWRDSDDAGIAMAVEAGNEHIVLTAEEWEAFNAALAPVVDQWIEDRANEGFDSQALADAAREALAARRS
jgi:TRAP-type C4-dicarboxylate transport system substrate-binding protein